MQALQPRDGGRYVDATVGGGGHAEKVLELSSPSGMLLGLDADPSAILAGGERLARFGRRATLVQTYSDDLFAVANDAGFSGAAGVLFDLGVSSHQIDTAERGFSFGREAPLDMRFGPGAKQSARDLVNGLSAEDLERVFRDFGEERYARRIARAIVDQRRAEPIETTSQLADVVTRAQPRSNERINPATRVFQALRIATNDELGRLQRALPQALSLLQNGGRLVVISFHSLEDRIVKQFIRDQERGCTCPPELPVCMCGKTPTLRSLYRKPVVAGPDEVRSNPRARSAKLRAAEKITEQHVDVTSTR